MKRAYSLLTIKAVDDDQRIIEGIATTPSPDRMGDIVEPEGAEFKLPIPLLSQHRSDKPIGHVIEAKVTAAGVWIKAKIEKLEEPGAVKDRLDEAWHDIKLGLVRGLSIGFKEIESARIEQTYSYRYLKWLWLELSAVTIPANGEATIQTVKSIDTQQRAASGHKPHRVVRLEPPGVSGKSKSTPIKPQEGDEMKTLAEQITALEAKRAANAARMEAVMQKSIDEGRSTDQAEQEEFDTLDGELKAIDADLVRLRALEAAKARSAKPIMTIENVEAGTQTRAGIVVVKEPKPAPGILFARLARVKALAKLDGESPRALAKEWYGEESPVYQILVKAAVPAASSLGTWAGALVGTETSVFADFVEFLRPQTIVGRFGTGVIPSLRRVPFRVPLIGQTSGGSGYWVGEGKPKPLTKFDFERKTLGPLKVANIAVATMEVLRDSSPSAEMIIRDQLAAALRERMDLDFIDPAKAAAAGVSPASITNGVVPITSTGNTADDVRADIRALFNAFIAANNAPTDGVWIMPATVALSLSLMQNPLGQAEFPGISMAGGVLFGLPVIVSQYVPTVIGPPAGSYVILANASDIYLADDGEIAVDMSQEASLQMEDNPTNASVPATPSTVVSLWQTNSVGFRAERTINWMKRRAIAVQVLDGVNWGAP